MGRAHGGDFAVDVERMLKLAHGDGMGTPLARAAFWLTDSEMHCVACYRFGQFARRARARHRFAGTGLVILHKLWNRWITHIDHADIHPGARIGPGLLIMHRHGILIGPAQIGANLVVHQNVTIGQRVAQGDHGVPRIGDNVWIGAGATICGAIDIGDGSTVSAGAVLTKSVPARSLVAGNPARVIATNYDNSPILNVPNPEG